MKKIPQHEINVKHLICFPLSIDALDIDTYRIKDEENEKNPST